MLKRTFRVLIVLLIGTPPLYAGTNHSPIGVQNTGRSVYERYCIGCHGEKGDGMGPGSRLLVVKPRDFTKGIFKFKSTQQGSLPLEEDLLRTITKGLAGSSMPNYYLLPEKERLAVIGYIKTFSKRWMEEAPGQRVSLPVTPLKYLNTESSIKRGKAVYFEKGSCNLCHGDDGGGKGPIAEGMTDAWNNPVKPADFTRGVMKSGSAPEDIFRTLKTGVEGTPMPSFTGTLTDEEIWDVISYIQSLKKDKPVSEMEVKDEQ